MLRMMIVAFKGKATQQDNNLMLKRTFLHCQIEDVGMWCLSGI